MFVPIDSALVKHIFPRIQKRRTRSSIRKAVCEYLKKRRSLATLSHWGGKSVQNWCRYKLRAVGMNRAQTLVEAAHNSIDKHGGNGTRVELQMILEDCRVKNAQLEKVTQSM